MRDAGCRLLIVGYEIGRPADPEEHQEGRDGRAGARFTRDCKKLGLVIHGDFIVGLPGETRESIRSTIDFAKELDCETIQVSLAHAYPGTEFYDFAKANGFIANEQQMVDDGGHQLAHIEYPGLPREEALEAVHRFYDEYYFRPKAIFRIVRKAVFDSVERKRLYKEAKAFLKLRAERKKYVAERRADTAAALAAADGVSGPHAGSAQAATPAAPGTHPELRVLNNAAAVAASQQAASELEAGASEPVAESL